MTTIEALYDELENTRTSWLSVYDILSQGQYDCESTRISIDSASTKDLHARILLIFDLISALRPADGDIPGLLFISAKAIEITGHLNTLRSHTESILNQLRTNLSEETIIRDGNDNFSLQLFVENTNVVNFDISASVAVINNSLNQIQVQTASLASLCKSTNILDLTLRTQALAEVVRETESLRNKTRKLLETTDQNAQNAAERDKGIQDLMSRAETVFSKLQALQLETEKEAASVVSLTAQIKTTGASADTLEQQITSYQSKFDAFQSQLDNKLRLFSDFENFTIQADQRNKEREGEIDRLTEKADTMIRGATTAGLSKSLEDTRELYSKRMFWARIGFFVSIIFMTISALPLSAHLLPGVFGIWSPAVSEAAQNSKFGVLGKMFLLLPATWLTVFFTKSFAEFFHLEREYAHKAALAKSVEGFKREAPKYQEEITSSVFGEILNNPSKGKSPEPANHPLYEVLTKRLTEWFGKKGD
jgi:hypothetical protein